MTTTKLRRIGRSRGVIIPAEALAAANLATDDVLDVTVTDDGRIILSPYDPDFDRAMAAAAKAEARYRNALRELAEGDRHRSGSPDVWSRQSICARFARTAGWADCATRDCWSLSWRERPTHGPTVIGRTSRTLRPYTSRAW